MSENPSYWLMKSEPDVFSIEDLKRSGETLWEGVRNYQARNFMMNDMREGDLVLFYHSNAEPPGIAGLARVSGPAVADPTQFQKKSEYYDEKATKDKPRWFCVPVQFVSSFKKILTLTELREAKKLQTMKVLAKGQRLSVQPVTKMELEEVLRLANEKLPASPRPPGIEL